MTETQAPATTLLGVPLRRITEAQLTDHLVAESVARRGGWVCPINLDVLRQIRRSGDIHSLVLDADILVADGMPLIWASKVAGDPLPERVAGSSLITTLPPVAAAAQASVFLLGGNPGSAEAAAASLRAQTPGLSIAGTHCPAFGFEHDPEALQAIRNALQETTPDFVFVGLGFPKQDRLIRDLRAEFPSTWFISCGVSLSFASGEIRRAPAWMQAAGLEWMHRLVQEPRRLAKRYLLQGIPFMGVLLTSAVRTRLFRRR